MVRLLTVIVAGKLAAVVASTVTVLVLGLVIRSDWTGPGSPRDQLVEVSHLPLEELIQALVPAAG